jgi:hypothetical protein
MPLKHEIQQMDTASTFELKIAFEKHSERPSRVFESMARMIDSLQLIDRDLLTPFDLRAQTYLILEDIKIGSLRTVLTTMLRSLDDESLKSGDWKKIVGNYLVKSKYQILHFLEDKKQITERGEIEDLASDIHKLAVETDVKKLPAYKPVPLSLLLRDIQQITVSLQPLNLSDTATFQARNREIHFNQNFQYHQEAVEALLTKETKTSERPERLKVKKPDYLGESMWEFVFQGRVIMAKIVDHNWLLSFQSRKIDVRPGDALSVLLQTQINYGFQGEEIAVHHRVSRVDEVIRSPGGEQADLL